MLRGMDLLMQAVVIELCSVEGPNGGSGFVSALREVPYGADDIASIARSRLSAAQENLLRSQSEASLSDSERLRSLDLVGVAQVSDGWEAGVSITAVSGETIQRVFA